MNIFYLDSDPVLCASMHCDKHVVKMMCEYAQLMSTAHRILDGDSDVLYKASHVNHPSNLWVRSSIHHYIWLYRMWAALSDEYTKRYNKVHASWDKLGTILAAAPKAIPKRGWIEPPECMPGEVKLNNVRESYRNYYRIEKRKFAKWAYSAVPDWY